jgi:hypothetical protein
MGEVIEATMAREDRADECSSMDKRSAGEVKAEATAKPSDVVCSSARVFLLKQKEIELMACYSAFRAEAEPVVISPSDVRSEMATRPLEAISSDQPFVDSQQQRIKRETDMCEASERSVVTGSSGVLMHESMPATAEPLVQKCWSQSRLGNGKARSERTLPPKSALRPAEAVRDSKSLGANGEEKIVHFPVTSTSPKRSHATKKNSTSSQMSTDSRVHSLGHDKHILNCALDQPTGGTERASSAQHPKSRTCAVGNSENEARGHANRPMKRQKRSASSLQPTHGNQEGHRNLMNRPLKQWSIHDVMHFLTNRPIDDGLVLPWLDTILKNDLNDELKLSENDAASHTDDKALARRFCELKLMRQALAILVDASSVTEKAMSLQHWKRFEVKFLSIDGVDLSVGSYAYPETVVNASVSLVYECGTSESLTRLPSRAVSPYITYPSKLPPYGLWYNRDLTKGRAIEIALTQNPSALSTTKFVIQLSELDDLCANGAEWKDTTVDAVSDHNGWIGGRIFLEARQLIDIQSSEYVRGKRNRARKALHCLIKDIFQFNNRLRAWDKESRLRSELIGSDLMLKNGAPLLHAAIYLEDANLLQSLVGAKSFRLRKSCVRRALNLAENLSSNKRKEDGKDTFCSMIRILEECESRCI